MGDVWGQQPKRPAEPPPAPLLPAEQAWIHELKALPAAAGVLDTDRVYIPLQEGGILALARETGAEEWTNPLGTAWPLMLAADFVIIVTSNEVAALDRTTGMTRWRVPLPARSLGPAIVTHDVVAVAMDNSALVALRIGDGQAVWSRPIDGLAAPVWLAADDTAIYLTMEESRMAAVAVSSGELIWRIRLVGNLSPPTVAKDRVFVGSTSNTFYALDSSSGKIEWNWGSQMIGGDVIGAAADGDVTFFSGLDNLLHAVNRGNGNQRWKQQTPTRPIAPPRAFGGIVAVFGVSPAIAVFNAKTGAAMGTYVIPTVIGATTAPIPKGPPIIDPDLRPFRVAFVVVSSDGRAIGLRPTGMMFRDPPPVPLAELPGKPLQRERLPTVTTRP
jgi:outer membrane protein assembly factor BamB